MGNYKIGLMGYLFGCGLFSIICVIGLFLTVLTIASLYHRTIWLDTYAIGYSKYATEMETLDLNETTRDIHSVDISPDDTKIVICERSVELYDLESKKRRSIISPQYAHVDALSVRFSHDGSKVAYGGAMGIVGIADVNSASEIMVLEGPMRYIRSVDWSPDETKIIVSTDKGSVILLDITSRQAPKTFQGYQYYDSFASSFSPDGKVIYSGHGDGTLCAWSVESGELLWF